MHRIALGMVRLKRCAMLEAEFLTAVLNPVLSETITTHLPEDLLLAERLCGKSVTHILDPGIPSRVSSETVEILTNRFGRYETSVENRLMRALHELDRLQRLRRGEAVPPPTVTDVSVHAVASFGNPAVPVSSGTSEE